MITNFNIYLVCILYLQIVYCRLPQTRPRPIKRFGPITLPTGSDVDLSRFKFPNKELCYEMEKNWGGSLVMPWWAHGCHDLKVKTANQRKDKLHSPKHKEVLNKLQMYRKENIKRNNEMISNWARKP